LSPLRVERADTHAHGRDAHATFMTTELPKFDPLWNYGDPAATEAKFRALLPQARASGDAGYELELLTQIARTQGLQGKFDAANATLDEVESRLRNVDLPVANVRYLLERGRVFNSSGKPELALPLFVQAAERAERIPHWRYAIDAVHMAAIAEPSLEKQVEWNRRGIAMVLDHPDQRGWLFALYNNLGESFIRLRRYDDALACFRNYVALNVERGQEPDMFATKDIAKCLRLLGDVNEALATIEPVHAKLAAEGQRDGWISEEYAECLLAQGKADEARPHFAAALELLGNDPWVLEHEPAKLARLKAVSKE
jgi:tetratricopeptide (TPR) repeat protein